MVNGDFEGVLSRELYDFILLGINVQSVVVLLGCKDVVVGWIFLRHLDGNKLLQVQN